MFCPNCGSQINENAEFCPNCATTTGNGALANTSPAGTGRVGYSTVINTPEFLTYAKKHHKQSRTVAIVFSILLPLIGALGGAMISEGSALGIIIGAILGFIGIAVIWSGEANKNKRQGQAEIIDGTITNIRYFNDNASGPGDGGASNEDDVRLKITLIDSAGREHSAEFSCDKKVYNYYKVGEVVRHHRQVDYLEKYDKTHDSYAICALCKTKTEIDAVRCSKCNAPMLK